MRATAETLHGPDGGCTWPSATTRSSSAAATTASSAPPISPEPGCRTVVLEKRHVLGGAAVDRGDLPGLPVQRRQLRRVSLLRPEIIRELELPKHGLDILPLDGTFTPLPRQARRGGGDYLWRVNDHGRTIRELRRWSPDRRRGVRGVRPAHGRDGQVHQADPEHRPARPDRARPAPAAAAGRPRSGRSSSCPRRQQAVFVQLMTMSATDFLDQWFETDPLKATMSASGIIGTFQGVRARARPTSCSTTTWARSTAPSGPGGSRGRHRRRLERDRRCGAGARRRDPDRGAGRAGSDVRDGRADGRRPRVRRGDRGDGRAQLGRRAADLPRADRARDARPGVRGRGPPLQVPRLVGQGQPGGRPAARLHLPARRRASTSAGRSASRRRRRHGARLRRREVRPLVAAGRTST